MAHETSSTSNADHGHDDHHGGEVGHLVPMRILVATGTALLFLTVVTVLVAEFDLGEFNIYVALAIAVVKGSLVALFFMHLRWDRPFNAIIFVGSLLFVALFLALAMTDSAEYQADLLPGDSKSVVDKIAEVGSQ